MVGMDDDRHSVMRGIWAKDFRRQSVEELRSMVTDVVDAQIVPFVQLLRRGSTADAMAGAARAIPAIVIAKLLGLPEGDHHRVIEWSERMVGVAQGAVDPSPNGKDLVRRGMQAVRELNDYLRAQYLARRNEPGDDLISRLICSSVSDEMTERSIVASYTQLLFAGNETTPMLMGSMLYALDQFPEQRALIFHDRSLIPQAVEEVNRWMGPAEVNRRLVRVGGGGGHIGDVRIDEGSTLLCLQGIANRDSRRWEDPDRLDVLRRPQPSLGFGFGIHSCLGVHLARLENQIWLSRVLDLLPDWHVTDVDWGRSWVARGPSRIDIAA
jgi:cytochrome P450